MSGYIGTDGKYHKVSKIKSEPDDTSSTYKSWSHDEQRKKHRADIVQPYKNGQLNPEFKLLYPEESKLYERTQ